MAKKKKRKVEPSQPVTQNFLDQGISSLKDTYSKVEDRYGPNWSKAIGAAGLVGLPIPVPGAMLATAAPVLGAAEIARALQKRAEEHDARAALQAGGLIGQRMAGLPVPMPTPLPFYGTAKAIADKNHAKAVFDRSAQLRVEGLDQRLKAEQLYREYMEKREPKAATPTQPLGKSILNSYNNADANFSKIKELWQQSYDIYGNAESEASRQINKSVTGGIDAYKDLANILHSQDRMPQGNTEAEPQPPTQPSQQVSVDTSKRDINPLLLGAGVLGTGLLGYGGYKLYNYLNKPKKKEKQASAPKDNWVKYVMDNYTSTDPPKKVFTFPAEVIADAADVEGVAPQGLTSWQRMVLFHKNRGGSKLPEHQRTELDKAIKLLTERRKQRQAQLNDTYNPETLLMNKLTPLDEFAKTRLDPLKQASAFATKLAQGVPGLPQPPKAPTAPAIPQAKTPQINTPQPLPQTQSFNTRVNTPRPLPPQLPGPTLKPPPTPQGQTPEAQPRYLQHTDTLYNALQRSGAYADVPGGLNAAIQKAMEARKTYGPQSAPLHVPQVWNEKDLTRPTQVFTNPYSRDAINPRGPGTFQGYAGVATGQGVGMGSFRGPEKAPQSTLDPKYESYLRHELRHEATQLVPQRSTNHYPERKQLNNNVIGEDSLGNEYNVTGRRYAQADPEGGTPGMPAGYLTKPTETGVRLAQVKEQYARQTGKLVTTPEEAKQALDWYVREGYLRDPVPIQDEISYIRHLASPASRQAAPPAWQRAFDKQKAHFEQKLGRPMNEQELIELKTKVQDIYGNETPKSNIQYDDKGVDPEQQLYNIMPQLVKDQNQNPPAAFGTKMANFLSSNSHILKKHKIHSSPPILTTFYRNYTTTKQALEHIPERMAVGAGIGGLLGLLRQTNNPSDVRKSVLRNAVSFGSALPAAGLASQTAGELGAGLPVRLLAAAGTGLATDYAVDKALSGVVPYDEEKEEQNSLENKHKMLKTSARDAKNPYFSTTLNEVEKMSTPKRLENKHNLHYGDEDAQELGSLMAKLAVMGIAPLMSSDPSVNPVLGMQQAQLQAQAQGVQGAPGAVMQPGNATPVAGQTNTGVPQMQAAPTRQVAQTAAKHTPGASVHQPQKKKGVSQAPAAPKNASVNKKAVMGTAAPTGVNTRPIANARVSGSQGRTTQRASTGVKTQFRTGGQWKK